MATAVIPNFDPFDVHADSAIAQRWRKWIKRLENLFVAANIKNAERQRALLLHYAGEEVCDIFEVLPDTGEDFKTAKEALTEYFDPKKNVEYEIYKFRQTKQNTGETMDTYHSRLRRLAARCEFTDVDKEIKSQIIQSCSSQRLRRKALKDAAMTLQSLLDEARALEVSEKQAIEIESTGNANTVLSRQPRNPKEKEKWKIMSKALALTVVELGPMIQPQDAPLTIESAIPARNMATMRNIVAVPEMERSPRVKPQQPTNTSFRHVASSGILKLSIRSEEHKKPDKHHLPARMMNILSP